MAASKGIHDNVEWLLKEVRKLTKKTLAYGSAATDNSTAIGTFVDTVLFHLPFAFEVSKIRATLDVAQASGSIFTVDIKADGVSILSTLITIDNTELTSVTAVIQAVISNTTLLDNARITCDVTQVGNGTAIGLKIWLIGTR